MNMRVTRRAAVLLGAAAIATARVLVHGAVPDAPPASLALAVPGRANANVSLAASGPTVVAAWSAALPDGATDIFAAISRDGGASFAAPVRVNHKAGDARVNGEQPPRVTVVPRGTGAPVIVVVWTARAATGTVLLTGRSEDGGRSFSASTLVPGTDAPGNRGWEAIGADSAGGVHLVWLDHRRMATPDATRTAAAHQHGAAPATAAPAAGASRPSGAPTPAPATRKDGVAMAQQSDLYFDTLTDAAAPRPITPGVCYCCKTAVAFGRTNQVFLAWRHVYPGNFRDMAFAASQDGGRTFASPVRVSQDNWMLEGCPDDGPTMKVDGRGRIHIVWPAVVVEKGTQVKALFYAHSTDGRTFQPRVRIPTEGQANHPQLALAADGSLQLAWDESGGGSRRIITGNGRLDEAGRATFARMPLADETGVYPVVAETPAGTVVAWTAGAPDASVIRIRRLQRTAAATRTGQ